ncbi:MAG: hypothetical protein NVS2B12_23820 [Ktedonobacteraceae bacterium]
MTFSSRAKMNLIFFLIFLVIVAGALAFYNFGLASSNRNAHAATVAATPFTGTTGNLTNAGTVDPSTLQLVSQQIPPDDKNFGRYFHRPKGRLFASNVAGPRPSARSASRSAGTLLQNFDGVTFPQSYNATGGLFGEPPDEGLGVGNGFVFNIVNRAGAIYYKNGTVAKEPFSVNSLFKEDAKAPSSDPRTYYDKATNTWYATVLLYTLDNAGNITSSHVDIAVNTSGNPLKTWTIYSIDTTDAGGTNPVNNPGCPCLADYPIFGIDQYNIYISTNEFDTTGTMFNGAQVYAIAKSTLAKGASPLPYVHFGNLSAGGTIAYHLQPAISYGKPDAEYFMNSLDPNGTFDSRLGVWALTNRAVVATGGMPTLTQTVISSEAYGLPVNAPTPVGFNGRYNQPTAGLLNADDDAMQNLQYINGKLYSSLDTAITIPGDTSERDGVAWFEVKPTLTNGAIGTTTKITDQGYISLQGLYLLYPYIARSQNGTLAITFSFTGSTTYPSAAYAVRANGQASFQSVQVAAAGVTADNGYTGTAKRGGLSRWGDYSAGELDPQTGNIWLATQYIPGPGNFAANWGNRIFEVKA